MTKRRFAITGKNHEWRAQDFVHATDQLLLGRPVRHPGQSVMHLVQDGSCGAHLVAMRLQPWLDPGVRMRPSGLGEDVGIRKESQSGHENSRPGLRS